MLEMGDWRLEIVENAIRWKRTAEIDPSRLEADLYLN